MVFGQLVVVEIGSWKLRPQRVHMLTRVQSAVKKVVTLYTFCGTKCLCLDPASNNSLLSSNGMNCINSSLISSLTWIYTLGTSRVKKDEKRVS